jgi:transcription termination/antitermination protein NusG
MAKKWYVVHTLSGHEARVKSHLEHVIESEDMKEQFGQILLPTQEVLTIKKGKRVTQTKKFFPSYLVIEMEDNAQTLHLVTSTPGVTNFIGGKKPQPLKASEVDRIIGQIDPQKRKQESEIPFIIGDAVKIKDGPFRDFDGTVDEISVEKGKLKVMVSVFGRLTPVELDFLQVIPL